MKTFKVAEEDAQQLKGLLLKIASYNKKRCQSGTFCIQEKVVFAGEGIDTYFFNGIFNPAQVDAQLNAEYIDIFGAYYKALSGTLIAHIQYDNAEQLQESLKDIVGTYRDFTSFVDPSISNVFPILYPQQSADTVQLFVDLASKSGKIPSSEEDNYAKPIPLSELAPYVEYNISNVSSTGFDLVFTSTISIENWM